jgi:hypothetical protein
VLEKGMVLPEVERWVCQAVMEELSAKASAELAGSALGSPLLEPSQLAVIKRRRIRQIAGVRISCSLGRVHQYIVNKVLADVTASDPSRRSRMRFDDELP